MVLAVDFSGLNVWADALASILLLELCVLLLIIAALVAVLAFGARWLQMHVVPLLNNTVPPTKQALEVTNQASDRVVRGVAEVYGVQSAVQAAARVMMFGKDGARAAAQSRTAAPTVPAAAPAAGPRQPSPASPSVMQPGPQGRQATTEQRPPDQPYDNMAANAG